MGRKIYNGGSTIMNPKAEAISNGKRVEGTYTITRIDLIHQIKQGNWDVGFINNKKLYGEILKSGGLAIWAMCQPELHPGPPRETQQTPLPLPIARKPPRNRRRR